MRIRWATQVRRSPPLLHLSVAKGLPPKLAWFEANLGLGARAMGPVALACPALLTYATASLDAKVPRPTRYYVCLSKNLPTYLSTYRFRGNLYPSVYLLFLLYIYNPP